MDLFFLWSFRVIYIIPHYLIYTTCLPLDVSMHRKFYRCRVCETTLRQATRKARTGGNEEGKEAANWCSYVIIEFTYVIVVEHPMLLLLLLQGLMATKQQEIADTVGPSRDRVIITIIMLRPPLAMRPSYQSDYWQNQRWALEASRTENKIVRY